jgi:hypothetical protein
LRFLQAIEGIWCQRILGFVRMDEKGFVAVGLLDVGLWDTWLEVENCIGVEIEDITDSYDSFQYSSRAKCCLCDRCLLSISASWIGVSMTDSILFNKTRLVQFLAS